VTLITQTRVKVTLDLRVHCLPCCCYSSQSWQKS